MVTKLTKVRVCEGMKNVRVIKGYFLLAFDSRALAAFFMRGQ